MLRSVMSDLSIAKNLSLVKEKIQNACLKRAPEHQGFEPRLVAVSKTKPKEFVIEAYQAGQRHFGENYVQELVEKANDAAIVSGCPEIKWHYIGHLQRNKIPKLLAVPNLYIVETVDSKKLADSLNAGLEKKSEGDSKLKVYIQVNTSGEEAKSGCDPQQTSEIVRHVIDTCSRLEVAGLMTIGRYDNYDPVEGVNPDFKALLDNRVQVAKALGRDVHQLEVSMGMSADYEHAVEMKIKRYKKVGRILSFYGVNFGFRKPYQILIDGTFCAAALNNKINVKDQLHKYLGGDVKLLTTPCIILETESLGQLLFGASLILKQFSIHQCGHGKKPVLGSQCILHMLGESNSYRYIIASQDRDVQKTCRGIQGVPLLYLHKQTPTLEQPSSITQDTATFKSSRTMSERDEQLLRRLNKDSAQLQVSPRKRKRKGGPNPLSCMKKKRKMTPDCSEGAQEDNKKKRHRVKKRLTKRTFKNTPSEEGTC